MLFIELGPFAAHRDKYLDDDQFAGLQYHLASNPEAGVVIPHSGGCRKFRWAVEGWGKRGGIRVIYFFRSAHGQIVLVTLYAKNVMGNADPKLLKKLREAFENVEND